MAKSLYKSISKSLKSHHSGDLQGNSLRRLEVLTNMVYAIISSKQSGLHAIGNHLRGANKQFESRVKQAKRWLDSSQTSYQSHFAPYIEALLDKLKSNGELVLVIDGSQVCRNCVSLMISVYYKKRAIPLVWLVREGKKGHFPEEMHIDLLRLATKLVPSDCRIVFLGDGEFDGTELSNTINDLGWEYVLRTRSDRQIDCGQEIAPIATLGLSNHERYSFARFACGVSHAIYWHEPKYKEPVFLLTNMDLAVQACRYYKMRFSIETMFSDIKSRGFNIHKSKTDSAVRAEKLLIPVAIAYLLVFLWGIMIMETPDLKLICRANQATKYSPFNRGCKLTQFVLQNPSVFISLMSKNFDILKSVRL